MKKNMGKTDKMIRLILAIIFSALYMTNVITGTIGIIFVGLGLVFVLTSMLNFCPLYLPFGIKTCKTDENK